MIRPSVSAPGRLERVVVGAIRRIDAVADWTGRICSWLVVVLMLAMVYEVVARYAFGRPTIWAYDVAWMTYGGMFMLCVAYTLYCRGHIRTDFFYNLWSPRVQGLVDGVLHICIFFPAMIFFFWAQATMAGESWRIGERSFYSPWQPVIYPLKMILAVSVILVLLQGVAEVLKCAYAVVKGRWP
jgi:TRAP-type mannitol/chloroaromatic compound transport system permease small subunit